MEIASTEGPTQHPHHHEMSHVPMKNIKKRISLIIIVSFIALTILLAINNSLLSLIGNFVCPKDYCAATVTGAGKCPNSQDTYYEQECYKYPATKNQAECESNKIIYYKVCGVVQK